MNEREYIDFMTWLETPVLDIKPYKQLTSQQHAALLNSLAYHRFRLKQASDEFTKAVRNSVFAHFPFLRS